MTVKELYEYAKANGMEDCKIIINGKGFDGELSAYTNEDVVIIVGWESE